MLSSRISAVGLLLFGLSWLAYDHYRPWVNFHSEALACAGVLALFSGQLLNLKQPFAKPAIANWLLLAASMPWIWWAVGIGLFAGDALIVSMYLLALTASVTVAYQWARPTAEASSGHLLPALAWTTALVAGLSATIGLVQWLGLSDSFGMYMLQPDPGDRALSNLGQPNQLGTLLLMGMAALLYLLEARRIGRTAFAVCIGFLTLGLVPTQSRAAMLSVVVVTTFLLFKGSHLTRLSRWALLGWALIVLVLFAGAPQITELLLLGEGRDLAAMTRTSDRLTIWHQVLGGIAQAPWLGYGWNQTPTAHAAGAITIAGTMTFKYAHNVILDLMAWTGIPLGLLWTVLASWWLCSRAVVARAVPAIAAMAGLLPLVVHSLVEFPFAYSYFLVLGGLLVGIVEAFHPGALMHAVRRRWAWALLVPWTAAGAYACYEYLMIEEDFRVVRFENLRIGQTPAAYEAPNVWMLSQLAEMLKASRIRPTPGMSPDSIEQLRKVALRFPWGALHMRYTYALALNGDSAGAVQQMRVVRGMFGEQYYAAAKAEMQDLMARYPQAEQVPLP